jgi:hypothetical protein
MVFLCMEVRPPAVLTGHELDERNVSGNLVTW